MLKYIHALLDLSHSGLRLGAHRSLPIPYMHLIAGHKLGHP